MAYADYPFYRETYRGKQLSEEDFKRLSVRSAYELDLMTMNRIKEPIPDTVRLAACAVAEILYQAEKANGQEVASESIGKQSVTYVQTGKNSHEKCREAAAVYLYGTGLLYRGGRCQNANQCGCNPL